MAAIRSLGKESLDPQKVKEDKKSCRRFGTCGVGDLAIYMPGTFFNRRLYIPISSVSHVYKRVAYSKADGKGLLSPVLFIVVRYDKGQERTAFFKDLREADRMLDEIKRVAPAIVTMSPAGERNAREKARREEALKERKLSERALRSLRQLSGDKDKLKKSPVLYQDLAGMARIKRRMDLIKPAYQWIVLILFLIGAAGFIAAIVLRSSGIITPTASVVAMLICAMIMILMINTRILPGPVKNRRNVNRDYEKAVSDMEHFIGGFGDFHLPAIYSHPLVIDMLTRIIREGRAETIEEALLVLKEDLKAADNTKVVSREEYEEIVTVKPMFTVRDYE